MEAGRGLGEENTDREVRVMCKRGDDEWQLDYRNGTASS